jgi:hypothetical protein
VFAPPPEPDPALLNVAPLGAIYGDSLLREAVVVARARNERMGYVHPCAGTDLYIYDAVGTSTGITELARADRPGCRIYFTRALSSVTWEQRHRVDALEYACKAAVHEDLHNVGLGHIPGTIMDPIIDAEPTPGSCSRWARWRARRS